MSAEFVLSSAGNTSDDQSNKEFFLIVWAGSHELNLKSLTAYF